MLHYLRSFYLHHQIQAKITKFKRLRYRFLLLADALRVNLDCHLANRLVLTVRENERNIAHYTLRISTNYTTIYRVQCGNSTLPPVTQTKSNEQNPTKEIEQTKSNERRKSNDEQTKAVTCQLKFNIPGKMLLSVIPILLVVKLYVN